MMPMQNTLAQRVAGLGMPPGGAPTVGTAARPQPILPQVGGAQAGGVQPGAVTAPPMQGTAMRPQPVMGAPMQGAAPLGAPMQGAPATAQPLQNNVPPPAMNNNLARRMMV